MVQLNKLLVIVGSATVIGSVMMTSIVVNLIYFSSSSETYSIKHPTNDKHHAIIQIINNGEKPSTCTAFVIDDTRAVTAGHCVGITKSFLAVEGKKFDEESKKQIAYLKKYIKDSMVCDTPRCDFFRDDARDMLEEEYAAAKEAKKLKPDTFKVINIYGEDTKVIATAIHNDMNDRDWAILEGDFKGFNRLVISHDYNIEFKEVVRSCGYAGGAKPPICLNLTYLTNYKFMRLAHGLIIRGMSGGPVLNKHGLVIGINAAVLPTGVLFDPIIGVFNRHFDKPNKKKEVKRESIKDFRKRSERKREKRKAKYSKEK